MTTPLFEERNRGLGICSTRARTNWTRKNIDRQEVSKKCSVCGERDESITHLIAGCKILPRKSTNEDMIILQELYTRNYAKSLAELARLSGIITSL